VRANTDRTRRLAFDEVAPQYERGRPRVSDPVVSTLMEQAQLCRGSRVLEIGAGTGQLTEGLLSAGVHVLALEPGRRMASLLQARWADEPRLRVVPATFEEFDPGGETFAAVVSANAFHWIDPVVSYDKAADLLVAEGHLALLWNAPLLADHGLQYRLNDGAFGEELADLQREPESYEHQLEETFEGGRLELAASGRFGPVWWAMRTEEIVWSIERYVDFLSSLASTVALADVIDRRVRRVLDRGAELAVTNYIYLAVARRR
jgi:SAM-dependent methyltransferase